MTQKHCSHLLRRLVSNGERLLIVENAGLRNELIDLTIIGEHSKQRWWYEGGAITVRVSLVWPILETLHDSVEHGKHHRAVLE